MSKKLMVIVLGLMMILSAGTAFAFMASGTADYTVSLGATCTVDTTAAATYFGNYALMSPDLMNTPAGTVSVMCSAGIPYILGSNGGLNPGLSPWMPGPPTMTDGLGNYIAYDMYNGAMMILGDWDLNMVDMAYIPTHPSGMNGYSGTGNGAFQNYALFADVYISDPALPAGFYSDTVTYTVVW